MESDTPRTDAENCIRDMGFEKWVSIEFARQLERELAAAWMVKDDLLAELAKVRQQRDEAQRDADRYRWLKSGGCYWVEIQSQPSGDYIFRGQAARSIGGSIDNAIDAVLAAQKEGGGA